LRGPKPGRVTIIWITQQRAVTSHDALFVAPGVTFWNRRLSGIFSGNDIRHPGLLAGEAKCAALCSWP
jgi:hypothetical protein